MPAIYGDSFGDLSRNVQSASNARQQALANSLNTAVAALSAARSHQTELQRLSQQKDQFGQEMELRKSQESQRKTESDRNYEMSKNAAGLNERYFQVYKDANEAKKDQLTPAKQREHDITFNQADNDATQGTFDSPEHVTKMYPALSPAEAAVIFNRSNDARRQIVSDYTTAQNAANVLNTHQQVSQRIYSIDNATKELQGMKNTWSSDFDQAALATSQMSRLSQQKDKAARIMRNIDPIAAALNKDKNVQQLVTFDPKTEQYVPTVPTPRWMKQGVANVPDPSKVDGQATGEDAAPDEVQQTTRTTTTGAKAPAAKTSTATVQGPLESTVKVRGRDGSVYNIPQSRVRDAIARGGALLAPARSTAVPIVNDPGMFMQ